MKHLYRLLLFIALIIVSGRGALAQTWKPLGPDEKFGPSSLYCNYTNITIAPDGTPYIIYGDATLDGKATVKKFDGTRWLTVGQPGLTAGFVTECSVVIAPDGTPYVASTLPSQQGSPRGSLRRLNGDNWVDVWPEVGGGINLSLAFSADGVPYVSLNGYGINVQRFDEGWNKVGDDIIPFSASTIGQSVTGTFDHGSKLIIGPDGLPYVAYSPGTNSNKISVKKLIGDKWQLVGPDGFTNGGAKGVCMALANDGTIYVAYQDSVAGYKAMVQQYKNGQWSLMTPNGLSKGSADYLNIAIGASQKPYLVFSDGGDSSKATVMQLNGSSWTGAGPAGFSATAVRYIHIAVGTDGTPYVIYEDDSLAGKAIVKKLVSNKWIDVADGSVTDEASALIRLKETSSGATYVLFTDGLYNNRISVKEFKAGAWQYVGDPAISSASVLSMDMDVAPDGTPYVIYPDIKQVSKTVVKKFTGGAWQQVGGLVTTGGSTSQPKIAIAADGTPYTAYSDLNFTGQVTVRRYTGGNWEAVGTTAFSVPIPTNINIAIDKSSMLYVAYCGENNDFPTVKKYTGGTWTDVGSGINTSGKYLTLALAPDGTPYVAYYDLDKKVIQVKAFTNNTWTLVGGDGADNVGSIPRLIFDKGGQLYLGYLQQPGRAIGNNPGVVKKLVQGKWADAGIKDITPLGAIDNDLAITPDGNLLYAYLNTQVFVRMQTSDDQAASPVIVSCSPAYGSTGTVATIAGFNFSNASAVRFGDMPAATFTVVSPTEIRATVGPGASGPVIVVTANGKGTYQNFTFTRIPPVITSFSPHFGDINSTVTIQGRNFGATPSENIVYFGGVLATVISATTSALQVKVPAGGTYMPISVTTRQLTAYSAGAFDVTFKGDASFTPASFAAKRDYQSVQNPAGLLISDVDNDGKPELLASYENLSILKNTSSKNGVILTPQPIANGHGTQLSGVDMDGDGLQDIASQASGRVYVSKNSTAGNTPAFLNAELFNPAYTVRDFAAADFDGDGKPDMVAPFNTAAAIFRNAGISKNYIYFEDEVDVDLDDIPSGIAVADIDGDGKPDIIVANRSFPKNGKVVIYKNVSTPHVLKFINSGTFTTGENPQKPVIADIDGDGKPDIVVPNWDSNTLSVLKNQSTQNNIAFAAAVDFATGKQPTAACVADLNGDRSPDIAVVNALDNTVSVLKNTSTSAAISFAPKVDYATGKYPQNVVAGDLDGDGAPELVTANNLDNTVSVLRNNLINTLAADSITFGPIADVTYGHADIELHAKSTDTLNALTYTSSDSTVVTITDGNKAHIVKIGQVIISALQQGGTAALVAQKLNVLPAAIAVTADDKTRQAGTPNPRLTLSYKGFVNGEDTTVLITKPIAATIATDLSPVGTYAITVSGGSALNYTITGINGTLTVTATAPVDTTTNDGIIVSKLVTPNGDGVNDRLEIKRITDFPGNKVIIVNRNGVKIFEVSGYDNNGKAFDGRSNLTGAFQQQGTYFYEVDYTDNKGKSKSKIGFFALKY